MEPKDKLSFVAKESDLSSFVRQADDYVILFKGNSITSHGIRENLWDHVSGMAASSASMDYVHRFAEMVRGFLPGRHIRIVIGRGGRPALSLQGIDAERAIRPDLIVIQNGEHSAFRPEVENFGSAHETLVTALQHAFPSALILSVGIWNPRCREEFASCCAPEYDECAKAIEKMQRRIAEKTGIGFVPVSPYENDPANTGYGSSPGVRWHPNDNGMKCYAEALFRVFLREFAEKRAGDCKFRG